ncbi:MAG: hypothetical protein KDD28_10020 [Phaeodactylibacter sp.]|nr:hypothetical protein [Phaeodactylibacter sp.]
MDLNPHCQNLQTRALMKRHCPTLLWILAVASTAAAQPTFFKQYQSDNFFIWSGLAAGSDGVSMAVLATNFQAMFVSKLDVNGTVVWAKGFRDVVPGNGFLYNGDIAGVADGGFAVAVTQTEDGGLTQSLLMKVSAGGNFLWAYRIPGLASGDDYGLEVQGNDILLSTSSYRNGFYLARFDAQGQPQWAKRYTIEGYEDYFLCSAVFAPGGRILLRGSISPTASLYDEVNHIRMEVDATTGVVVESLFSDSTRTGVIAFDEQRNHYESYPSATGPRYAKYTPDGQFI